MSTFKFYPVYAAKLTLANLSGLCDETQAFAASKAPLLGELGMILVSKLQTDLKTMKSEMDKPRSSLLTPPIRQANDACDATLNDIKRSVKAGNKSTIPTKATAGDLLFHFLESYWNLNKLPLMSQISLTSELIWRYESSNPLQQAAETLGISNLFTALKAQNTTLATRYNERVEEYAAATPAATTLKNIVAEDYDNLSDTVVRAVNAQPESAGLVTLFNEMDNLRKKYSALLPNKIDLALAITEPIPNQTHTGKAITPIPKLFYEGKELTFAVDFSVTYRHNVEVGEATVIMHGKGKFTGQHTRKFNIEK